MNKSAVGNVRRIILLLFIAGFLFLLSSVCKTVSAAEGDPDVMTFEAVGEAVVPALIRWTTANLKGAQMEYCFGNIRTIESSVAMYNMEHSGPPLSNLEADGLRNYLFRSTLPVCEAGGKYTIIDAGKGLAGCSVHGSLLNPTAVRELPTPNQILLQTLSEAIGKPLNTTDYRIFSSADSDLAVIGFPTRLPDDPVDTVFFFAGEKSDTANFLLIGSLYTEGRYAVQFRDLDNNGSSDILCVSIDGSNTFQVLSALDSKKFLHGKITEFKIPFGQVQLKPFPDGSTSFVLKESPDKSICRWTSDHSSPLLDDNYCRDLTTSINSNMYETRPL